MGVRVKTVDIPDIVNIRSKNFIIEKARVELIILYIRKFISERNNNEFEF